MYTWNANVVQPNPYLTADDAKILDGKSSLLAMSILSRGYFVVEEDLVSITSPSIGQRCLFSEA
jgi:hypothetical protein